MQIDIIIHSCLRSLNTQWQTGINLPVERWLHETSENFREYIEALRSLSEVQEIEIEVDWNLEIGAITRRTYELRAPAPLFNNIARCEPGFRVMGAPIGLSANINRPFTRLALSIGLPAHSSAVEIVEAMSSWETAETSLPFHKVPDAPCKQNKMLGPDIDLLRFRLIHDGDGGRYFGTLGIIVTQSPDKKWTNWSIQRCMLQGKDKLSVNTTAISALGKHTSMIYSMWQKIGKPMPFALVQGVEPAAIMIAGTPLPDYVSEGEVLGAYFGENIDVVSCETQELEVPASARSLWKDF